MNFLVYLIGLIITAAAVGTMYTRPIGFIVLGVGLIIVVFIQELINFKKSS